MKTYDVLVLGGGSAGTSAAAAAHAAGARTAMFNDGELGGLCILRGCMPTKTVLHAAHLVHEAAHHATPGIGHADLAIDFPAVMANKAAKVARFKKAKLNGIAAGGYEVIDARARFTGPDTVEAGGETYRFTRGAVVAVGSSPVVPAFPGIEGLPIWDSDDVLALEERPASAIVMGGGAIGLELGQFLARMGTRVLMTNRSGFLSKVDEDVAAEFARVLDDEPNLERVAPFAVERVEHHPGAGAGAFRVHGSLDGTPRVLEAERFVVCTGRDPALAGLGLEAAGVEVQRGAVVHDGTMRTTNPRVFVAGDATGRRLLLHVANWEGRAAGRGAAEVPGDHTVETRLHMEVIFSDPPFARVGLTAAEAEAAGIPVVTALQRFPETGRAITMDARHGTWKLVARADTGELLGTQILGPRADDLVHVVATAMHWRATARDLLGLPWYHPTLTEVLLSLVRSIDGQVARPT